MLKKVRPGIVIDVRVSQFFMLGETKVILCGKDAQVCHLQIEHVEGKPGEAQKFHIYTKRADLGEYVSVGKSRIRVEKKHGQVARLRVVAEKGIVIRRQNAFEMSAA
jgi:hypothetical protein